MVVRTARCISSIVLVGAMPRVSFPVDVSDEGLYILPRLREGVPRDGKSPATQEELRDALADWYHVKVTARKYRDGVYCVLTMKDMRTAHGRLESHALGHAKLQAWASTLSRPVHTPSVQPSPSP